MFTGQIRSSSHATFPIKPTQWQWQKTKDFLHFYVMLGVIPLSILTFVVNVFVGPATLEPIPEGYEPKYWEYERVILYFLCRILKIFQRNNEKDFGSSTKYIH